MVRSTFAGFLFLFSFAGGAYAQSCSVPNNLTNGTNADATQVMANFNALLNCVNNLAAPRGYIAGLTLSTPGSSAAFGVAAGSATSDDTTTSLKTMGLSKTTSAWAVGSGSGSLDTGSIANNTWYHVFLIATNTGAVDVLISLSATTPALPASYTKQRRIGSMKTNGSSQWIYFHQIGDDFLWDVAIADVSAATSITNANTTYTLSVPLGLSVQAFIRTAYTNTASAATVLYSSPLTTAQIAGAIAGNNTAYTAAGSYVDFELKVWTNTSSQVNASANVASNNIVYIITYGWTDRRGKDA